MSTDSKLKWQLEYAADKAAGIVPARKTIPLNIWDEPAEYEPFECNHGHINCNNHPFGEYL